MVYQSLESFSLPDVLNRKKYDDLGLYEGSYNSKALAQGACLNIINALKEYQKYLESIDLPILILVGVSEKKLFFLDEIYFKFRTYEGTLEVSIDLKDNYTYPVIENAILSGKFDSRYAALFEKYWNDALYCVFLNADLDCEEFVRGDENV